MTTTTGYSGRQTISTRYLGPTATKGARIKAAASGSRASVTIDRVYSRNVEDCHAAAARALQAKLDWHGHLVGGHANGAGLMVWVDATHLNRTATAAGEMRCALKLALAVLDPSKPNADLVERDIRAALAAAG